MADTFGGMHAKIQAGAPIATTNWEAGYYGTADRYAQSAFLKLSKTFIKWGTMSRNKSPIVLLLKGNGVEGK